MRDREPDPPPIWQRAALACNAKGNSLSFNQKNAPGPEGREHFLRSCKGGSAFGPEFYA